MAHEGVETIGFRDVVGARYVPASNRLFLLVADGPRGTTLYVDEVVHLARVALDGINSWGFSLEFERRATRPFAREDLTQPWEFVAALNEPGDSVARAVRDLLPPSFFTDVIHADRAKPFPRRLLETLTRALNRLRDDAALYRPDWFSLDTLSGDTIAAIAATGRSHLRRNRLLLEDHFPEAIVRHTGTEYMIQYRPDAIASGVRRHLDQSRLEGRLLAGDLVLKSAAYGIDLPSGLALGASQAMLCQQEMQDRLELGLLPGATAAPFVLYFDLETDYAYPAGLDLGFLFANARLVVRHATHVAGLEAPPCVQAFVRVLNRNLGRALDSDSELGERLRALKALLLVNRVVHWALGIFVPVHREAVASFRTPRFTNRPPALRELLSLVPNNGGIAGVVSEGGVRFDGPLPDLTRSLGYSPAQPIRAWREPGFAAPRFVVAPQAGYGPELIHVDISSIVGLTR